MNEFKAHYGSTKIKTSEEIQNLGQSPRTYLNEEVKPFEPEKVYHMTHENLYLREKQVLEFLGLKK